MVGLCCRTANSASLRLRGVNECIPDEINWVSTSTLTLTLLYLPFPLTLSVMTDLGSWDCPAACRRQDSGTDVFVTLWHGSAIQCVGSRNRSGLCPKLEPLMERPTTACSDVQEGVRTL